MKVFVSYTTRDGMVTPAVLRRLHAYLCGVCNPFIHSMEQDKLHHQQFGVLKALLGCDIILLLVSPGVSHSRWVKLELWLGRVTLCPVIRFNAADLAGWAHEA